MSPGHPHRVSECGGLETNRKKLDTPDTARNTQDLRNEQCDGRRDEGDRDGDNEVAVCADRTKQRLPIRLVSYRRADDQLYEWGRDDGRYEYRRCRQRRCGTVFAGRHDVCNKR